MGKILASYKILVIINISNIYLQIYLLYKSHLIFPSAMGCNYSSLKDKLPKHHKPSGLIVVLFMANKVAYTITGNIIYSNC